MAPARAGDTMVAGVRRTGSAEPKAPPPVSSTTTRTTMTAAGTPIASHRPARRCGTAPADSVDRLIRSPARSAFFAAMAPILTPPATARAREPPDAELWTCLRFLGYVVRGLTRRRAPAAGFPAPAC